MFKKVPRNRWEIQAEVIEKCPSAATELMFKAGVSYTPLKGILERLVKKGYVEKRLEHRSPYSIHKDRWIYYSTSEGRRYAEQVRKVADES